MKLVCLLLLLQSLAHSQETGNIRSAFDVVSVKRNKSGDRRTGILPFVGGRFRAVNVTPRQLIQNSYRLQDFQIIGGPAWLKSTRYDVDAVAGGDPGSAQVQSMVRSLLADRFQFKAHRETRQLPVYVLLRSKKSEKLRPASCAPDSPVSSGCGGFRISRGYLTGRSVPISHFAANPAFLLGRPVIDKTGLEGNFDIELLWSPDQATADTSLGTAATAPSADAPPIFTALQEQLGLRLKAQRGAVDVLVIDHIALPSEN